MVRIFLLLIISALCISCGVRVDFTQFESSWVDVYNQGDTLIFESTYGQLDTSIITGKSIYHPSYDPITKHDKYVPVFAQIQYKNKSLTYNDNNVGKLVSLIKYHPDSAAKLFLDYQYSSITILKLNANATLPQKVKEGKIYKFDAYHPKSSQDRPRYLYWHEKYGLIKYITHGGIVWKCINLDRQ